MFVATRGVSLLESKLNLSYLNAVAKHRYRAEVVPWLVVACNYGKGEPHLPTMKIKIVL